MHTVYFASGPKDLERGTTILTDAGIPHRVTIFDVAVGRTDWERARDLLRKAETARSEPGSREWLTELDDAQAIADYIVTHAGDEVDFDYVYDYFRGAKAVLRRFLIADIQEGDPDHNVPDPELEAKYALLPAETMPPIVVEGGQVEDGNHRLRARRRAGDTHIAGYDVIEDK